MANDILNKKQPLEQQKTCTAFFFRITHDVQCVDGAILMDVPLSRCMQHRGTARRVLKRVRRSVPTAGILEVRRRILVTERAAGGTTR